MDREQRREYARAYYQKKRLKLLESAREYRQNYYHKNKKKLLAYQNSYYRNQVIKPTFKKVVKSVTVYFD